MRKESFTQNNIPDQIYNYSLIQILSDIFQTSSSEGQTDLNKIGQRLLQ